MGYSKPIQINSWETAADLSAVKFIAVRLNGANKLVACVAGEPALGIMQETMGAFAAGHQQMADVTTDGISKGTTGAAVTDGDLLASDVNGNLVRAVAGDNVVAEALEDAAGAASIIAVKVIGAAGAASTPAFFSLSQGAENEGAETVLITAQLKRGVQNVALATKYRAKSIGPSATALLSDGGAGTVDIGSGTTEIRGTTDATGKAEVTVTNAATETNEFVFEPEKGVPTFITVVLV